MLAFQPYKSTIKPHLLPWAHTPKRVVLLARGTINMLFAQ